MTVLTASSNARRGRSSVAVGVLLGLLAALLATLVPVATGTTAASTAGVTTTTTPNGSLRISVDFGVRPGAGSSWGAGFLSQLRLGRVLARVVWTDSTTGRFEGSLAPLLNGDGEQAFSFDASGGPREAALTLAPPTSLVTDCSHCYLTMNGQGRWVIDLTQQDPPPPIDPYVPPAPPGGGSGDEQGPEGGERPPDRPPADTGPAPTVEFINNPIPCRPGPGGPEQYGLARIFGFAEGEEVALRLEMGDSGVVRDGRDQVLRASDGGMVYVEFGCAPAEDGTWFAYTAVGRTSGRSVRFEFRGVGPLRGSDSLTVVCDGTPVFPLDFVSGAEPGEQVTFTEVRNGVRIPLRPGVADADGRVVFGYSGCPLGTERVDRYLVARGTTSDREIGIRLRLVGPLAFASAGPLVCDQATTNILTVTRAVPGEVVDLFVDSTSWRAIADAAGVATFRVLCHPRSVGAALSVYVRGSESERQITATMLGVARGGSSGGTTTPPPTPPQPPRDISCRQLGRADGLAADLLDRISSALGRGLGSILTCDVRPRSGDRLTIEWDLGICVATINGVALGVGNTFFGDSGGDLITIRVTGVSPNCDRLPILNGVEANVDAITTFGFVVPDSLVRAADAAVDQSA